MLGPFNTASAWGAIIEPAVLDVYGIRRANPDIIVDVGAHLGGFSCLAAHTHPRASVHAFEPQEDIALFLRQNIEDNGLTNVTVHPHVVTRDGRTVTFYPQHQPGGSGIFCQGSEKPVSLRSVTLDVVDLEAHRSLFLKLDCEGTEAELIDWMLDNQDSLPPTVHIACEWHPWCPGSLGTTLARMRAAGFVATSRELLGETYLIGERSVSV